MRMWEIRENEEYREPKFDRDRRLGFKTPSEKAYECGYEEGYREAMKEAEHYYSEKRSSMR